MKRNTHHHIAGFGLPERPAAIIGLAAAVSFCCGIAVFVCAVVVTKTAVDRAPRQDRFPTQQGERR